MNELQTLQKALKNPTLYLNETEWTFLRATSVFSPSFASSRYEVYALCLQKGTQSSRTIWYSINTAGISHIFMKDMELTLFLSVAGSLGL